MSKAPKTSPGASFEKPQETHRHEATARVFSDYVVYVDESGDHSLASIDPDYPIFVLAFCVFHKHHYGEKIIPAVEKLKFNYFGHDSVVLHENEIRRQKGLFTFLSQRAVRREFIGQLNSIMETSNFILIACVVDKARVPSSEVKVSNPYHIALGCCLDALRGFLAEEQQDHFKTHVIVERRGRSEDRELELEFRRVCDGHNSGKRSLPFDVVFADKKTNLTGLQLADLVARPVGVNYLRPAQTNRAFELLMKKFYCDGGRENVGAAYEGIGLLLYPPQKAKSLDEPTEAITPTRNPQST
jgi:hypothetical protein